MADNIQVVSRFRPLNNREKSEKDGSADIVVSFPHETQVELANISNPDAKPYIFNFDACFPSDTTQLHFYKRTAEPLLDNIFKGINTTIFSYGQTGAGKTHTMMGKIGDEEQKGIIPRLVESIFQRIDALPEVECTVKVSYVEIYNEQIRDLLDLSKDSLKIRASGTTVWLEGGSNEYVQNAQEVYEVIERGGSNRAVSATLMNAESSRSHSVLIITIGQKSASGVTGAKLTLVDLAGSEKVSKTGAEGQTFKEAQHINKSLSALGNVINALSTPAKKGEKRHIPYRDSKLTYLLSDSLGGSAKTCLIIAASPARFNHEETLSTLRFGMRAKTIQNKIVVNQQLSEAEYQRLLAMKDGHILTLADILSTTFYNLHQMYSNVSHVDPTESTLAVELTRTQRGKVSRVSDPKKHASWDDFSHEYEEDEIDIPMIIQAIRTGKDVDATLKSLKGVTGEAIPVTSTQTAASKHAPSFDDNNSNPVDDEIDFSKPSTTMINDLLDSPSIGELSIDGILKDVNKPAPSLDEFDKSTPSTPVTPESPSDEVIDTDLLCDVDSPLYEDIEHIVKKAEESISRQRSSSVTSMARSSHQDEALGASGEVSPADQVLSLLRFALVESEEVTNQILAHLIDDMGKGQLSHALLDALRKVETVSMNQPPTATPVTQPQASNEGTSVGEPTTTTTTTAKKVMKTKAGKKKTASSTSSSSLPSMPEPTSVDESTEPSAAIPTEESPTPPSDVAAEAAETAKRKTKRVVKKATRGRKSKGGSKKSLGNDDDDEDNVDDESDAAGSSKTTDVASAISDGGAMAPSEKTEEAIDEKSTTTTLPTAEDKDTIVTESQPPSSEDIFARAHTANFATIASDDDDADDDDDDDDGDGDDNETGKDQAGGDDNEQPAAGTDMTKESLPSTIVSDKPAVTVDPQHDVVVSRDAYEELQEKLRRLEKEVSGLQSQVKESDLHISSLRLQNDLLKESQQDPVHQGSLQSQQQQTAQANQVTALTSALERKCRELVKSEVRLSACCQHIDTLELTIQQNLKEKSYYEECVRVLEEKVLSLTGLCQQLYASGIYWKKQFSSVGPSSTDSAAPPSTSQASLYKQSSNRNMKNFF